MKFKCINNQLQASISKLSTTKRMFYKFPCLKTDGGYSPHQISCQSLPHKQPQRNLNTYIKSPSYHSNGLKEASTVTEKFEATRGIKKSVLRQSNSSAEGSLPDVYKVPVITKKLNIEAENSLPDVFKSSIPFQNDFSVNVEKRHRAIKQPASKLVKSP